MTLFTIVGGAFSQQALPYEYGFEDNDLSADGWIANIVSSYSGIKTSSARTGSYGFTFQYSESSGSLISPVLTGGTLGVDVSFWYKEFTGDYGDEKFQVGYTTNADETDPANFTYGDVVTASTDWQKYVNTFPAGTKRIAIKYIYTDAFYLYLDDFSFEAVSSCVKPTGLAVNNIAYNSAVLSWTSDADAWDIDVNGNVISNITTKPYTLTGLTETTDYTVKVRTNCGGGNVSKWTDAIEFTTPEQFPRPTDVSASNITYNSAEVSWTADAEATRVELQYAEGDLIASTAWYKYDQSAYASAIGLGGSNFSWGVMFPAGSYTGDNLTKVSVYDVTAMTGSITIYNDGVTSPDNEIASIPITLTGAAGFVEFDMNNIAISNTKNLWIVVNNESGTGYPAATCDDVLDDANGRWVQLSGNWYDVADVGMPGKCFMVRAEIGTAVDPASLSWTIEANATSPYLISGLNAETHYVTRVKAVYAGGESVWINKGFTTAEANPVPSNIIADLQADGATLAWDGNGDTYNLRYRTATADEVLYFEGFENGLDKWTIYTEGESPGTNGWYTYDTQNGLSFSAHEGTYAAVSWSWNSSAYNADNWLVSPQVDLNGTLKFWVRTNNLYPDAYEVLLSTTGNAIADFTVTLQAMATAPAIKDWTEVSIDLSAYAGQKGYIAIHHVDYDANYLLIDAFGIYGSSTPAGSWQNVVVDTETAILSGLANNTAYEYQIQSVRGGNTSDWSDVESFALLTLANAASNEELLVNNNTRKAYVTLGGRTLYQDDSWNTLCLPFDLNVAGSPLDGATVKVIDDYATEFDSNTLTVVFEDAPAKIPAGTPFIVKWASGSNITNPSFANVNISNASTIVEFYGGSFVGNYSPVTLAKNDYTKLYLGAANKLYWPASDVTLNSFRAYFDLPTAVSAPEITVDFGDEVVTGISNVKSAKTEGNDSWYTVDGRKLDKQPTTKGVYVNNGRKVVVK